ncbi:MAG: stage III sporulation protein AG, partial [Clostridiaceae bacterium]
MDIIKRIKDMIDGQSRKKLIENTAIVIVIGIIVIIAGGSIFGGNKSKEPGKAQQNSGSAGGSSLTAASSADDTELKLKSLLSQMQGVGKVDVMVTYYTSKEEVPAYDIKRNQSSTDEKDSEGGTRRVSEEEYESTLAYEDSSSGGKSPVILKELEPEVKGVLVVAEGADSVVVRERVINAVAVLLDV